MIIVTIIIIVIIIVIVIVITMIIIIILGSAWVFKAMLGLLMGIQLPHLFMVSNSALLGKAHGSTDGCFRFVFILEVIGGQYALEINPDHWAGHFGG